MKHDYREFGDSLAIEDTDTYLDGVHYTTGQLTRKLREELSITEGQQIQLIHLNDESKFTGE